MTATTIEESAVISDPAMPFLGGALDRGYMEVPLRAILGRGASLDAIHLRRWKRGRRCLVEYCVSHAGTTTTLLGKMRARSLDHATYDLVRAMQATSGASKDADEPAVPRPVGVIPDCHMWLQEKVDGTSGWDAITGDGAGASRRIGCALARFHARLPHRSRSHSTADEIAILSSSLDRVAAVTPAWKERLARIKHACSRVAGELQEGPLCGIHRDFYHDQVLVAADRVWILDLDLTSHGSPALDVGNFVAHITEQSLRLLGDPCGCATQERAFVDGYRQAGGEATTDAVDAFKTLALARHIFISTLFESRRRLTGALVELCEQRLQL